jgi:hypothetical protein
MWTSWGSCDKTCGGGQQRRTRPVLTPASGGGTQCPDTEEYRPCNTMACTTPVNCVVGMWTAWSACDKTCGGGQQRRTRPVTTPASGGGTQCPDTEETRPCNTQACVSPGGNFNGCTPGFWKNHVALWSQYTGADFDATFGVNFFTPDMTLVDAIQLNGEPLIFHAIAAYLNSIFLDDFGYSTSQVINLVRQASGSGDRNIAGLLASANEAGSCPLGGGPATKP